ncbi:hypothetical protein D8L93_07770 [Sodalis-like symbiont of Bactericera trigonica]|nr:hypothetical protein D8L93_07770 [Sodalis-like symbiont of Bactericera trigonica]
MLSPYCADAIFSYLREISCCIIAFYAPQHENYAATAALPRAPGQHLPALKGMNRFLCRARGHAAGSPNKRRLF